MTQQVRIDLRGLDPRVILAADALVRARLELTFGTAEKGIERIGEGQFELLVADTAVGWTEGMLPRVD